MGQSEAQGCEVVMSPNADNELELFLPVKTIQEALC
jgi:hypothetical protein